MMIAQHEHGYDKLPSATKRISRPRVQAPRFLVSNEWPRFITLTSTDMLSLKLRRSEGVICCI